MDFSLTEEQEMLSKMARDFLTTDCPKSLVREMAKDEKGYPLQLWQKMGELGWMGLNIPEEYGGAGASFLDLVVLLEEMGRACLPGPFFSTVVLGGLTIMEAGSARLRPILMTSLTTALGLLPMALGFGEGAEVRTPMAITVIGGLLVSTLLTLVVIPVVYSIMDRR